MKKKKEKKSKNTLWITNFDRCNIEWNQFKCNETINMLWSVPILIKCTNILFLCLLACCVFQNAFKIRIISLNAVCSSSIKQSIFSECSNRTHFSLSLSYTHSIYFCCVRLWNNENCYRFFRFKYLNTTTSSNSNSNDQHFTIFQIHND